MSISISILVARRSALADLSITCVTIASRLVILRRRPSIVTRVRSFRASAKSAGRLLALRPPGLPDWPFLETGVQRRPARTHLVIAPAVRHAPPSVASGNRSRG